MKLCYNFSSQLELAIAIVKKLLSVLDPRDVFKLYGVHLGRALEHPAVEAKRLVLNEVYDYCQLVGNFVLLLYKVAVNYT